LALSNKCLARSDKSGGVAAATNGAKAGAGPFDLRQSVHGRAVNGRETLTKEGWEKNL